MRRIPLRDEARNAAVTEKCGRQPDKRGLVERAEGAVNGDGSAVADEAIRVKFLNQRLRIEKFIGWKDHDRRVQWRAGQAGAVDVSARSQAVQADPQDLQEPD